MAQSSTTISGQKTFKSAITVSEGCTFTATGGTNKISAASTSLSSLSVRDIITITGTTSNNSTFTIKSVDTAGTFITVEETVTAVNVIMLNPNTCCTVNATAELKQFMKKHGIDCVNVPNRHRYILDSGLHCKTLDLKRKS